MSEVMEPLYGRESTRFDATDHVGQMGLSCGNSVILLQFSERKRYIGGQPWSSNAHTMYPVPKDGATLQTCGVLGQGLS